jgi:hypothetical protein
MPIVDTATHGKMVVDSAAHNKNFIPVDPGKFAHPDMDTGKGRMHCRDSAVVVDTLKKKLRDGMQAKKCHGDSAKLAAIQMRKQLHGKNAADSAKIVNDQKAQKQEHLQNAINQLDKNSAKTKTQVEQVKDRVQSRMQEKQAEWKQHKEAVEQKKQNGSTTSN